jgi:hypothetical protein
VACRYRKYGETSAEIEHASDIILEVDGEHW